MCIATEIPDRCSIRRDSCCPPLQLPGQVCVPRDQTGCPEMVRQWLPLVYLGLTRDIVYKVPLSLPVNAPEQCRRSEGEACSWLGVERFSSVSVKTQFLLGCCKAFSIQWKRCGIIAQLAWPKTPQSFTRSNQKLHAM